MLQNCCTTAPISKAAQRKSASFPKGLSLQVSELINSTAKINPAAKSFCFRPKQSESLTIPIRLNGTNPILIQYSHTSFSDPPVVQHHDILSKNLKYMLDQAELSEEPGEEGLQILPLDVSEQGAYKLERVVDKTGHEVRIYRSEAIVVECPSAEISSFNDLQPHFCQGEVDALKIHVRGVPPLHLTYSQEVNGHAVTIPIDSIKPESFVSSFIQGGMEMVQHRYEHVDYTFALTHPITLTYPLTLDVVGRWDYTLLGVTDALGNSIEYKGTPPGYRVSVHELPKIQFRGCSEDSPTKLLKGRDSNLYFNVHTTEQGPFNVTLAYNAQSSDTPVVKTYEIQHKRDSLSIETPGVYSIVNVTSRYCHGDVLTPQSCLVITPAEPTLQIEWSTLKDHCSGTVGVTADLTFTGEPPFHLSYRVLSRATNTHEIKRFKVDRTRHQIDFRPDVAGTYVYEFIAVDDVNYRYTELEGGMYAHEATIHPLPGARFTDLSARKTCIGSNLSVPVRLIGSGPWNLTYDISESGAKRKSKWTTVQVPETWLELPDFTKGGKATVSLRSVTDGSGCTVQLGEDDLVLDVRREKPSARFYATSATGRDGDAVKLPLRLTGEGPWFLRYALVDTAGQRSEHDVMANDPNGFIEVRSDGIYELVAVADSTCPGVIKSGFERFEVIWIARPKVDIVGFEGVPLHETLRLDEICAGEDAFLDLTLHGIPLKTHI
jgi:nucleoporin POM152